jgi:SM-20-related protein
MTEQLADDLARQGWAVAEGFFEPGLAEALAADLKCLQQKLKPAGTGKGRALAARTDHTHWLDGGTQAQQDYLARMEDLRRNLNRALYLGLFDYECHYAVYEAGGFYEKHIDSLHGARNRIVSCVTYLTPGWTEQNQGHLVLYHKNDQDREITRILPSAGTLAMFMSEDMPHEVRPPNRPRASIAGWFRCNSSTEGRIDPLR